MDARVVKLSGFEDFERNLRELPKATGKNVLRRVGRGALEPMADAAAAKAPVRTGRLSFSISVSEKRTRRASFSRGAFRSSPSTGIEMAMGPAAGFGAALTYASFDEFGTVDTPAFGYMRYAWNTGAARAVKFIGDNLGDIIAKAANRLAVKRAKAGL